MSSLSSSLLFASSLLLLTPSTVFAQTTCESCTEAALSDAAAALPIQDASQQRARDLFHRVSRAWRLKDWPDVIPAADALIQDFPGTIWEARARALRGLYLKFEGEWDAALTEFDRVLALTPPQRLRHDVLSSRA